MTLTVNFEDLLKSERGRKALCRYVVGEPTEKSIGFELSPHNYEFRKVVYYPPSRLYFCIAMIESKEHIVWTKSLVDETLYKINYDFGTYLFDISTIEDKILVVSNSALNVSEDGGATWKPLTQAITDDFTCGLVLPESAPVKYMIGTVNGLYAGQLAGETITFTKVYNNIDISRMELNDEALLIFLSDNSCILYSTDLTTFETVLPGPITSESASSLSILDGYYSDDKLVSLSYSTDSLKLYKSVYDIDASTIESFEIKVPNDKEDTRISFIQKYENQDFSIELILSGDKYSTNSGKTWLTIPQSCAFVQTLSNNRFVIYEPVSNSIYISYPMVVIVGNASGGIPPEAIFSDGDIENGNIAIHGVANGDNALNIGSEEAATENNIRIGHSNVNHINLGQLEIIVTEEKLIINKTSEEKKSFEFLWSLAPY
jgi:hypothetical protein